MGFFDPTYVALDTAIDPTCMLVICCIDWYLILVLISLAKLLRSSKMRSICVLSLLKWDQNRWNYAYYMLYGMRLVLKIIKNSQYLQPLVKNEGLHRDAWHPKDYESHEIIGRNLGFFDPTYVALDTAANYIYLALWQINAYENRHIHTYYMLYWIGLATNGQK